MNFLLWRTAANQLFVLCSSSGWSPKPLVSVLDGTGSKVPTEPEVVVRPDGLFSVSVRVSVAAVDGKVAMQNNSGWCRSDMKELVLPGSFPPSGPRNKSVICRVEVPDQHLSREQMIAIAGKHTCSAGTPTPLQGSASCRFLLRSLL